MKLQTMMMCSVGQKIAVLGGLLLLAACASAPERSVHRSNSSVAQQGEGYYKVGRPYQIKGVWYYPEEDYSYDETGIASWYGADFHDKLTANGEVYNMNELTAAHKTLPMPSLARVTNLENGRAIVVRINDRGPYAQSRIIDLSKRSAQLLGFERQGTAKVRVQVLSDESKAIAEAMNHYGAGKTAPSVEPSYKTASIEVLPPEPALQPENVTIANVKPVPEYVQMPVTAKGDIYIQAGAFSRVENALNLKAKLSNVGQVNVSEALVKGRLFYRVRVGPIPSVPKADKLLRKVLYSGADNARIIVD